MSGIFSLEASIRTCKTDVGYAERIQSDRFFNPKLSVCPVWNGLDAAGRVACADSFNTKREGCNSALDRVGVENLQRPQYMNYISAQTAAGSYNVNSASPEGVKEGFSIQSPDYDTPNKVYALITGSNGDDIASTVWTRTCGYDRYDRYAQAEGTL